MESCGEPNLGGTAVAYEGCGDHDRAVGGCRAGVRPDRGSARAWLAAILLDQTRRHRVRNRRRPEPFEAVDQLPPEPASDVEHAVTQLPRRQREVVTLHYLLDLPLRDIARVLDISEGSVKSHLHDARASLRTKMETTT